MDMKKSQTRTTGSDNFFKGRGVIEEPKILDTCIRADREASFYKGCLEYY